MRTICSGNGCRSIDDGRGVVTVDGLAAEPTEPATIARTLGGDLRIKEMETQMIRRALKAAGGNQSEAAKIVGVTRDAIPYGRTGAA